MNHRLRPTPWHWLPAAVLLLAAALRFWQLGQVPPGFQFDEAYNAIDAARVLDGQLAVFFPANGGREPLLTYLHAPLLALLGRPHTVLALRLVSALVGVVTVAVVYVVLGRLTGDRRVGLLAAALLAVSYWHLHFSRYAIRAILAPLWTTAVMGAWANSYRLSAISCRLSAISQWRVGARLPRVGRAFLGQRWAVLTGVLLAAAAYSHPSGRLLPLVLVGHAAYLVWADRERARMARQAVRALVVAGATSLILFLPLGLFFLRHPGLFLAHPSDVSLAAVAASQYGGSLARALAGQVGAVGGMLFLAGDPSTFHNLPGLPVFDPLSALAAAIGVGVLLGAVVDPRSRRRAVLVTLWLVVMLVPTLLSDRPPNYSRAIGALPVIVLLPALGVGWMADALSARRMVRVAEEVPASASAREPVTRPGLLWALLASWVVVVGLGWTTWHYFVIFGQRTPHVYYSYDVDKLDAYRALVEMSQGAVVFLHPLWARHATIAYLNASGPVRELDATDTLVFPTAARTAGRDIVVAFPAEEAEREGWLERAGELYGQVASRLDVPDAQGRPLLVVYRIPSAAVGDLEVPTDAPLEPAVWIRQSFGGMIRLIGYSVGAAEPGQSLPVTFVWQAMEPVSADYTAFVHLLGPGGTSVGQEDREPGHVSYRTSQWQPGDVIIDRYWPVLDRRARGRIEIVVGWYDLTTGQRLYVGSGSDTALRLKPIQLGP